MIETELTQINCENCFKPLARVRPAVCLAKDYALGQELVETVMNFYCDECYQRIRSKIAPHWPA